MPYKKVSDLPEGVRHVLPKEAQEIYLEAFNGAFGTYDDEATVHKVAWSAVKKKYRKGATGKWVRD